MIYPNLGPRAMANPGVAMRRPAAQDVRDALMRKLTAKPDPAEGTKADRMEEAKLKKMK